jgi:hypothetical protein
MTAADVIVGMMLSNSKNSLASLAAGVLRATSCSTPLGGHWALALGGF